MRTRWTTRAPATVAADVALVPVLSDRDAPGDAFDALDRASEGALAEIARGERFRGKARSTLTVHGLPGLRARKAVLVGLGPLDELRPSRIRRAFARATRGLGGPVKTAVAALPSLEPDCVRAAVEGIALASYAFTRHKGEGKDSGGTLGQVTISAERVTAAARRAAQEAVVLAASTHLARDLVNEPPGSLTPTDLARVARRIARERGLRAKILTKAEIERRKMGGILGVSAGSAQPPRLIHLEYRPEGKATATIALVGKGITFDSGGLSLKPPPSMVTMKADMSGAAAVLGAMDAIAQLRPAVRVHGIVPASENLPGPAATKPGDVLRISNGKTVEVLNTDAEGRLVLADALTYAEGLKVDEVIDLATLTGACVVALGDQLAGLFSRSPELARALRDAGAAEGEPLWELPLHGAYKASLKSDVADLKNIGGRFGGAITAALFLSEFVRCERWAHLDIAGPAFAEALPELGPKGGTGFGVRTLVRYLLDRPAG